MLDSPHNIIYPNSEDELIENPVFILVLEFLRDSEGSHSTAWIEVKYGSGPLTVVMNATVVRIIRHVNTTDAK